MESDMSKNTTERLRQIAAATKSARPKDENPAWKNTHHDLKFVLEHLDKIRRELLVYYYVNHDGEIADMNNVSELDLLHVILKHKGE
jgi:hypothetical protein